MALDYVSFVNMLGDVVSVPNLVAQMIDLYTQKLEVGETRITDFNEGSEIRNTLEAYALLAFAVLEDENEATKLPFISSSYGAWLDKIGENPFIVLPRIQGGYATGEVTFTLADVQASDVVIPADTLIETVTDGLQFVTDSDCTIDAGETTGNVGATCLTMGVEGNIGAGELTVISDEDIDTTLISVDNSDVFVDGADYEDDEDYRSRLLNNVRAEGFGSVPYYINLGESVEGVHDVSLVNATGYTRKVLVNGYSKPTPDSVLLDVLAEYSKLSNHILNQTFTVGKPYYSSVDLTFDLSVTSEFTDTDLTALFTALVNGGSFNQIVFDGLDIGENLTHDLLLSVMDYVADIVGMSVKITGQSSEFTSTNIGSDYVVELGTLTFNQTVV